MNQLLCRLALLLYCMGTILFIKPEVSFVASFLLAVIFSCSSYFFCSRRYTFISTLGFFVGGLFFPPLYLFLPLVFYDVFLHRIYVSFVLLAVSLFTHNNFYSFFVWCYLIYGVLLSLLLQYLLYTYDNLYLCYKKTRDDNTEFNLLLKEKNQHLLEKQDYEIYTATLRERNRIAREIHDNVGHMISRSILMVGAMKAMPEQYPLSSSLSQLEDTLYEAMNNVRESVHDLRDESVNLKETITSLADSFHYCPLTLDYDVKPDVPKEIKYSFIMITKEALSNIMKHSNADQVHIILREHPGLYQLIIEDNGSSICHSSGSGIGLLNMEERIEALHGIIQFQTDSGFRIFITIPKQTLPKSEVH